MKKIKVIVFVALLLFASGCDSDARIVSENLSTEAKPKSIVPIEFDIE